MLDQEREHYRHCKFIETPERLVTLKHLPEDYARRVAEAGFFFISGVDTYNCHHCGLILFSMDEDPFLQHARLAGFCRHMRALKGQAYVQHVRATYPKPNRPWERVFY